MSESMPKGIDEDLKQNYALFIYDAGITNVVSSGQTARNIAFVGITGIDVNKGSWSNIKDAGKTKDEPFGQMVGNIALVGVTGTYVNLGLWSDIDDVGIMKDEPFGQMVGNIASEEGIDTYSDVGVWADYQDETIENMASFTLSPQSKNLHDIETALFQISDNAVTMRADMGLYIDLSARTDVLENPKEIKQLIKDLIILARDIDLKQSIENEYSIGIRDLILQYGEISLDILTVVFEEDTRNELLISDTLIWLGLIDDESTHNKRQRTLIHFLDSKSNNIRYGALLGLENLEDPMSIPFVERAIEREKFKPLKIAMEDVLVSLEG